MVLFYLVPETGVTLQITGYANGQFVVRLLTETFASALNGHDASEAKRTREREPVVAISVCGGWNYDGESVDVPAWKVREALMERIIWNRYLD